METEKRIGNKRTAWGIVMILSGVVLLLQMLNVLPDALADIIFGPQSILFIIGLALILQRRRSGLILLAIGMFVCFDKWKFLLNDLISALGMTPKQFCTVFIPLVLVVVGLLLIFRKPGKKTKSGFSEKYGNMERNVDNDGRINYKFFCSGVNQVFMEPEFKGGNIKAVCGGIELDLTHTTLPEGETILNIDAVMGGFTIKAPSTWLIQSQCVFTIGGISDDRPKCEQDTSRKLIITGHCTLGGGTIE